MSASLRIAGLLTSWHLRLSRPPDSLPYESRSVAEIVGGSPGQWEARLIRGTRTWQLRGTPPPGVSAEIGAKVTVRVVRPLDSKDHYLAFALERS